MVPGRAGVKRGQRGLVVGRRCTPGLDVTFRVARFLCVAFFAATAEADDETRVECFARWCRTFLGAASAVEPRANTATHASAKARSVLRIMHVKISYLSGFRDTLPPRWRIRVLTGWQPS